jgi:hypothetical protein
MSNLDLKKLLDEVEADVKNLLKSAQEEADSLKKSEESSKESSKKEESSKEQSKEESSLAKDEASLPEASKPAEASESTEGSGYENQAPEASEAPQAPEMSEAPADESVEDISAVMKDLDDDMLHELYEKIKEELMGRMHAQQQPEQQAPEMQAAPEQAPAPAPQMAAMKSETEVGEKLTKAEQDVKVKDQEIEKLKKSLQEYEQGLGEMTDLLKSVLEKPVTRAVTDIQFVNKDETLKKSELTQDEIKKAVDAVASNKQKLGTLSKSERETILDFYSGKDVKNKVLGIINK